MVNVGKDTVHYGKQCKSSVIVGWISLKNNYAWFGLVKSLPLCLGPWHVFYCFSLFVWNTAAFLQMSNISKVGFLGVQIVHQTHMKLQENIHTYNMYIYIYISFIYIYVHIHVHIYIIRPFKKTDLGKLSIKHWIWFFAENVWNVWIHLTDRAMWANIELSVSPK